MKIAILSFLSAVVAFATFTWWALESSGVAVLETRAADGSLRSTHVWFAEHNGELWLEAGTPENSWYIDIQQDPLVSLSAPRRSGQYVARQIQYPGAHDEIRSIFQEKYGVRDWWVGLLFDTSRSIAVQLAPLSGRSHE
ncbi:MAG TPA: nitroreductase/quinone reductase family protein [Fimbriimonadaceae bacterium]|nr:nitroreductase/quinone reductase family protein [Fimbriimonadaceae bacterium]